MPVVAIDKFLKPGMVSTWRHTQVSLRYTIDRQIQMWLTEYVELGIDKRLILNTPL